MKFPACTQPPTLRMPSHRRAPAAEPDADSTVPATRVLKKYPNRRLYDTRTSSYITLADVKQMVLASEDFEVRDAKTGEDLTRTVLLQIIAEHEERGQPMFSTRMLSQVIRFYGDSLQGFMGGYLERSMQNFLDQSQQFRNQVSGLMGQNAWQMVNELTERNLEIWKSMQSQMLNPPAPGTKPQTPPPRSAKK